VIARDCGHGRGREREGGVSSASAVIADDDEAMSKLIQMPSEIGWMTRKMKE
jgi:hypothetical protein